MRDKIRNSKLWKKILYVAAPVLWCMIFYLGNDASLGTVFAKVTTTAQGEVTKIVTVSATSATTESPVPSVAPSDEPATTAAIVPSVEPSDEPAISVDEPPLSVAPSSSGVTTTTQTMVTTLTETSIKVTDDVIEQTVPTQEPETQESKTESVPTWEPTTPEDIERISFVTKEPVVLVSTSANGGQNSADNENVTAKSALQGAECIESMKAGLKPDYQIACTLDIKYDDKAKDTVYEIDKPVKITMSLPKEMIKKGRTYEMICISKGGERHVIKATLDKDGNLTFSTKWFYAYAITYKDAKA